MTSFHLVLTMYWINNGVQQHEANERSRPAYKILRSSPLKISTSLGETTLHYITYGPPLAAAILAMAVASLLWPDVQTVANTSA